MLCRNKEAPKPTQQQAAAGGSSFKQALSRTAQQEPRLCSRAIARGFALCPELKCSTPAKARLAEQRSLSPLPYAACLVIFLIDCALANLAGAAGLLSPPPFCLPRQRPALPWRRSSAPDHHRTSFRHFWKTHLRLQQPPPLSPPLPPCPLPSLPSTSCFPASPWILLIGWRTQGRSRLSVRTADCWPAPMVTGSSCVLPTRWR